MNKVVIVVIVSFLSSLIIFQNCDKAQFYSDSNKSNSLDVNGDDDNDVSGIDPDADGDGLTDAAENNTHHTDPSNPDTDNDGLSDGQEVNTYHTDPLDPDTDDGGINDGPEVVRGTDPLNPADDLPGDPNKDTDGDGLTDKEETDVYHTDPNDPDTDEDKLSDGAEVKTHKTDPLDPDTDDGGATDGIEVTHGTNPINNPGDDFPVLDVDTDNDGLTDKEETDTYKTDPLNPDTDGDKLPDGSEVKTHKTDPLDPDTDDGGLADGYEVVVGKDPLDPKDDVDVDPTRDTDNDGLTDKEETDVYHTDPNNPDTDGDRLKDGAEVKTHKTDPLDADTDDGTIEDGDEVDRGTNPLDPKDDVPVDPTCKEEPSKYVLYMDPANSKDISKATRVGEVKAFTGKYTSKENYSYSSASAHPKVGPAPAVDTFNVFLYKGKDGLNLMMYSGQDGKGDDRWEPARYNIVIKNNRLSDKVKLSDDAKELRMVGAKGQQRTYSIKTKYKKNTDGGIIGPLVTQNFMINYQFGDTKEWKEAFFVSGDKAYSLGKGADIKNFIIVKEKAVTCREKNISIKLTKKPTAVSNSKEGDFIFSIDPVKSNYKIQCQFDSLKPFTCVDKKSIPYNKFGVGNHAFKVSVVDPLDGETATLKYKWEIKKVPTPGYTYTQWTEWKNKGACTNKKQEQIRTRQKCKVANNKKTCTEEIGKRVVACGGTTEDKTCTFNGKKYKVGDKVTAYTKSSAEDCTKVKETRTCKADGQFSGTGAHATCKKIEPELGDWINTDGSKSHAEVCASVKKKVSGNLGAGICASGEDRPQKGDGYKNINYRYGKWGGNLMGGSRAVKTVRYSPVNRDSGSTRKTIIRYECYRSGQKTDNDSTDIVVAYLCK